MRDFSKSVGNIAKPMMLMPLVVSMGFLAGCEYSPETSAIADCKQAIRDRLRDPSGAQIRLMDGVGQNGNRYYSRYRVRGENNFGAREEVTWFCTWTLIRQRDDGSYVSSVRVTR
jgi:hypothetical protein